MNIKVGNYLNNIFSNIAIKSTKAIGSYKAFIITIILIFLWLIVGPFVHFSDTWQLYVNTISTLTTSLIVILIQYSQNKNDAALHLKIDELIKSNNKARNELAGIEELTNEKLEQLKEKL